jgi:DEAD/DEAH box helicase domain-containing protein
VEKIPRLNGCIVLASFVSWLSKQTSLWSLHHHEVIPEKSPDLRPIPDGVDPRVVGLLHGIGLNSLYSHQSETIELSLLGKNVVLCTSTASGKTLAYQVPVLDRLVRDPKAHALFLFPLKALERDQRDSFLNIAANSGLTAAVYDGDTPEAERRKIRQKPPRVLITNPDMLHLGLLAFHETWKEFFGNLSHVVLDEVHTYKGIFGSHISQVILRMLRVCDIYRASPQFIACSATISNPGSLVSRLIGREFEVVDRSGAPSSERHFLFANPVGSPLTAATEMFAEALKYGLKTIVFTKARKITELITRWVIQGNPHLRSRISSYRAGFLPEERREIETKLFSGKMDGVISTSALEMGIDVGGLDLCVLVGYPGTIINTWQRGGRVGRAGRPSGIILIPGNDALDQYFLRNPKDLFERNCEEAILDPLNREVLKKHIPCAASETPIFPEEEWVSPTEVQEVLHVLDEAGVLFKPRSNGPWHSSQRRPHRNVDLRDIGAAFPIFLEDRKTLIGSSSGKRAFTECHKGAVYLHKAKEYLVTKLDLEHKNILVKPEKLNYYTRALSEKDTEILRAPVRSREFPGYAVREAPLKVTERITAYEKRKTAGQELIGTVDLELPPLHFETVGIWIEIPENIRKVIQDSGLNFMGGIHALEHAAISVFPLFALCDRDDIGGISTPDHPQVCKPAVFIYDGHPGGVGLSHRAFEILDELLEKTLTLVETCPCEQGCPSCIHSPKCGSGNKPLDKTACVKTLQFLLYPEKAKAAIAKLESKERQNGATRGSSPSVPSAPTQKETRMPKKSSPKIFLDLEARPAALTQRNAGPEPPPSAGDTARGVIAGPDIAPQPATKSQPRNSPGVVVFDLETQKLADEVGGWRNIAKMRVSLAVVHCEHGGFLTFREDDVPKLVEVLKAAELVVGFNQMRFDYEVLTAYTKEDLRGLPNLDILQHVESALGFRLPLNHLAEITLGRKKSGHGTDAAAWFREGRMDLIEKYCRDDVALTRDLYLFGLENGFLKYKRKDRRVAQVIVDWASGPFKR